MKDWVELKLADPLQENRPCVGHDPDGKAYAVCLIEGKTFVCENECLHQGGPLGDGYLMGTTLGCPWHGWEFDLATGECLDMPGECLTLYPSRLLEGRVEIQPEP
ncbi:MAG: Rieske 2Fe-2S domain-containing protein [Candidatus Eremiobacteraeota bacterium]|nr:Rieske 2Fe-2S domain-containing protein [Candidatus Eremiobacteraeota bacterium]